MYRWGARTEQSPLVSLEADMQTETRTAIDGTQREATRVSLESLAYPVSQKTLDKLARDGVAGG
jgi:hypothetical protein